MKRFFSFLLLLSVIVVFTDCKGGKDKPAETVEEYSDPRMDSHMERTNNDSISILSLTKDYLTLLKEGKFEDALAMVYEVDSTGIQPIKDRKRAELMDLYKNFPVVDFEIISMNLYSEDDVEVRYDVKLFELTPEQEGMPNTIKMAIAPRRVNGQWYITVPGKMMENNYN